MSYTPPLTPRFPAVNAFSSPTLAPRVLPGQDQNPAVSLTSDEGDCMVTSGLGGADPKSGAAVAPDGLVSSGYLPSGPTTTTVPQSSAASVATTWIVDPQGNGTQVNQGTSSVPLGNQCLALPGNSQAILIPGAIQSAAKDPKDRSKTYANEDELIHTYAGSDMRVLIEVRPPPGSMPGPAKRKQLIELTTISISVHRVKSPARACGYINPKGFARGSRTIAGTIILTQFTVDVMYRFLYEEMASQDLSKDSFYLKPDQLPPFDMTLMFSDEYGNASQRRLLGVDCATDGTVYSVNDMFTEQTISYYAADFTPLMPMTRNVLMTPAANSAATVQKTPMQVMPKPEEKTLTPSVDSNISFDMGNLA